MTTTPQDAEEQPDGIDDESSLPSTERAAERVNEFLAWFGDGLVVAETGAPPLFARDLQALTNLATGWRKQPASPDGGTEWGYRVPWGVEVAQQSEQAARQIVSDSLPGARTLIRREVGPWTEVQS